MVPTVTLVVAMRNEAADIADCLDSIAAQDHRRTASRSWSTTASR